MSKRSRTLSRRQFLAGAGGLLAIPLLPSAFPRRARAAAQAAANASVQRFVQVHLPAGVIKETWVPSQVGTTFTLAESMSPLASLQQDLLIISNMQHDAAQNSPVKKDQGLHARGLASLFSGARMQLDVGKPLAAPSMDQLFARSLAGQTSQPSLQLTLNNAEDGDKNYANQAIMCTSWVDATTPVTDEYDPAIVFAKYFATTTTNENAAQQAAARASRKSVLDTVLDQATSLQGRLSVDDKNKLDQYFTGVRTLEQQLDTVAPASCSQATAPASGLNADRTKLIEARTAAMMDLMLLAFHCDLTRSISFSFGPGHSALFYNFLGSFQYGRHDTTHFGTDADTTKHVKWELQALSRFWSGLKAIPEGSGTMLDNSVTLVSSEVAKGRDHNYVDHPVLIVGKGGGFIDTGRHVQAGIQAGVQSVYGNLTEVQLAILQGLGTGITSFGDYKVTKAMNLKA